MVSLDQYLSTVYEPDCDYVEGKLEERNLGEWAHSRIQTFLAAALYALEGQLGIRAATELRIRVSPDTYRVADVCVTVGDNPNSPPFLCVEIYSPEDRFGSAGRKLDDYLRLGVQYVWTINPEFRTAHIYTGISRTKVVDGILRTSNPAIEISLQDVFRAAER